MAPMAVASKSSPCVGQKHSPSVELYRGWKMPRRNGYHLAKRPRIRSLNLKCSAIPRAVRCVFSPSQGCHCPRPRPSTHPLPRAQQRPYPIINFRCAANNKSVPKGDAAAERDRSEEGNFGCGFNAIAVELSRTRPFARSLRNCLLSFIIKDVTLDGTFPLQ